MRKSGKRRVDRSRAALRSDDMQMSVTKLCKAMSEGDLDDPGLACGVVDMLKT